MDSAAGLAVTARDPHNQAIFSVRKPKNIFDIDTDALAHTAKSVFNDICDICGIEPGKKCDPEKSTMRYIFALTDADIDGDGIAFSVVCLLAKHCRPLIDAGMVGRILPPAYSFPSGKGKKQFVQSKREFFDMVMKKFIKEVTIQLNGKELSKKDLSEFLNRNFDYDKKLEALADRYCCDARLMEYIAWKYHGDAKSQKKSYWMNALKQYPEFSILLENGTVVIDGDLPGYDYINLAFDESFDIHVKRFKEFQQMNDQIDGYTINGEKGKTLYDVMRKFRKYMPKGVKRFKGLGELKPAELKELCMDRDNRTAIIFKFKDFEKDMAKINVIMSTKAEAAEARAKLLDQLVPSELDIDT